jgi:hypothetical protein
MVATSNLSESVEAVSVLAREPASNARVRLAQPNRLLRKVNEGTHRNWGNFVH